MIIQFVTSNWFEVSKDDEGTTIGVADDNGNYVQLFIKNKSPYNKHLKDLINQLNNKESK